MKLVIISLNLWNYFLDFLKFVTIFCWFPKFVKLFHGFVSIFCWFPEIFFFDFLKFFIIYLTFPSIFNPIVLK